MRKAVRSSLVAATTGAMIVTAAWAGVGLSPVPLPTPPAVPTAVPAIPGAPGTTTRTNAATVAASGQLPPLGAGQVLAGAAKSSIAPDPEAMKTRGFPAARWETDAAKCKPLAPEYLQRLLTDTQVELDHLASSGSPWPENPNCIYQGGFGLGPVNPVSSYDTQYGLWVRSFAMSDGADTLVLTVIDGEGWLWDYAQKCTDCGAKQIAAALAADPELAARHVKASSHVLHATHSHAAPDFIGGWGFVPDWYMKQVADTIKQTAKDAVLAMEPAVVETGEADARPHNNERRDTYRSAEEQQLSWLRAVAVQATGTASATPTAEPTSPEPTSPEPTRPGRHVGPPHESASPTVSPSATATPDEPAAPRVIATLGTYAAHPTTKGTNGGVAHADWPGVFEHRLEERFGGIGLHFMSGLGNISASGGTTMGGRLADLVPAVGDGRLVDDTNLVVGQETWRQPVTNVPLDALGTPGFFDRQFDAQPASLRTGKSPDTAPCVSASAQSVELPVTGARLGNDVVITAAPGEVFSNLTNTIKEKNAGRVTLPIGQANDALGYMPQSFEIHPVGQQGLGFVAGGAVFVNYEDSYAVDRCIGDMVLETTLTLLAGLK
ncbi:MAG TPA: hypothetical protein VNA20_01720 [Frankiaceae bacterium]|nr:hypothetical protein [Frankiaceae bacterium]